MALSIHQRPVVARLEWVVLATLRAFLQPLSAALGQVQHKQRVGLTPSQGFSR